MPPFKKIVEKLMKRAMEKGAKSVKLIPTRDVFAEDFVRQKCKYGCEDFAKSSPARHMHQHPMKPGRH